MKTTAVVAKIISIHIFFKAVFMNINVLVFMASVFFLVGCKFKNPAPQADQNVPSTNEGTELRAAYKKLTEKKQIQFIGQQEEKATSYTQCRLFRRY